MVGKKQNTKGDSSPQVEKYLTQMKELPNYRERQKEVRKFDNRQPENKLNDDKQPEVKLVKKIKKEVDTNAGKDDGNINGVKEDRIEKLITTKDILLGIINIASLTLLIILLIRLPEKAKELNILRNQVLLSESEVALEISEVEGSKDKVGELESLFIDEVGLVSFVGDVEGLKGENSSINKINITSQKVVKDKTGNYGIPVVIEMRGNWTQFGEDMQKIQKLPYLFRVIRIETEELEEEGVIVLKYGGFLYVHDKLGED